MLRNAKVKLRTTGGVRKVRITLKASVHVGLMVVTHVLIYRFIEVGCALPRKTAFKTANCARLCANQLPNFPAMSLCRFHADQVLAMLKPDVMWCQDEIRAILRSNGCTEMLRSIRQLRASCAN